MFGIFWKFARIGERLSPYVSICCIFMAVSSGRGSSLMDRLQCCGRDDEAQRYGVCSVHEYGMYDRGRVWIPMSEFSMYSADAYYADFGDSEISLSKNMYPSLVIFTCHRWPFSILPRRPSPAGARSWGLGIHVAQ